MDTKFSVAVHVLILISESPNPLNSDQMAGSVGTNASYIRKILALLKKAEIVDGHRGISGYSLTVAPEQLTLLQIYQAVMEESDIHLLDIHQNPGDQCIVGRHIRPALTEMFTDIEDAFARSLAGKTLADCIADIRSRIDTRHSEKFNHNN
ncbi:MAG: Rrf2 family transcriptional regulator [Lachnospiraceae bacterium]|nr:Rrf2 family transcriptional regulator [Lachnospiraceae bacterium]